MKKKKKIKLSDFDRQVYEELEKYEVLNTESLARKMTTSKYKVLCACYKLQELKLCTVWTENKVKLDTTWL